MSLPLNPSHGQFGYLNGSRFVFDSDSSRWLVVRTAQEISIEEKIDSEVNVLKAFFYQGAQSSGYPVGSVIAFASSSLPAGFLVADGSTFNQFVYPELYACLGNTNVLPDYSNRTLGFKEYDENDPTLFADVVFGIAGYNGAGMYSDSDMLSNVVQQYVAELEQRVTELEGDLAQAIADRVYTDNVLAARLDSDISTKGRFYVQSTPPSGGPNSGWVNTTNMRLHVWSTTTSVWTEVSLT